MKQQLRAKVNGQYVQNEISLTFNVYDIVICAFTNNDEVNVLDDIGHGKLFEFAFFGIISPAVITKITKENSVNTYTIIAKRYPQGGKWKWNQEINNVRL